MKHLLLLFALLVAAPAAAHDRWPSSGSGGVGLNVATDTDGDGFKDYVRVGDYDGDGTLEVDDIQAAQNAMRASTDRTDTTHPTLTARANATCTAAADCFIRAAGSFITDGFVNGESIFVSGFDPHSTGRTVLSTALNTACNADGDAGAGDADCLVRLAGSFVTDGFVAGQELYLVGEWTGTEVYGDAGKGRRITVVAVNTLQMEVGCPGIAAGATGCFTQADAARDGRWVISPGINGFYTVHPTEAITALQLPLVETLTAEETIAPVDGGGNPLGHIQGAHHITLDLASGEFAGATPRATNIDGLFEIESFTTLRGQGGRNGATVLRGDQQVSDYAVISGRREMTADWHRDVTIEGIAIDGGWDDAGAGANQAMGFMLRGFTNLTMRDVAVDNTGHTCLYLSNVWHARISNYKLSNCGNVAPSPSYATQQAAIYLFASTHVTGSEGVLQDVDFTNGEIIHSASGYNTRRSGEGNEIRGIKTTSLSVRDTTAACVNLAGVKHGRFDEIVCSNTNAFQVGSAGLDWSQAVSRNEDIQVNDVSIFNSAGASTSGAFTIYAYNKNVAVNGLLIEGSGGSNNNPCLSLGIPGFGYAVRNLVINRCWGDAIQMTGADAGANTSYSAQQPYAVIENVEIRGFDYASPLTSAANAFQATVDVPFSVFRNWQIDGLVGSAFLFNTSATVQGGIWENIHINGTPMSFMGRLTDAAVAALPSCDETFEGNWFVTTEGSSASDCGSAGGGATTNACVCACVDGSCAYDDMTVPGPNNDVIRFRAGATDLNISGLTIQDCINADGISAEGPMTGVSITNSRVTATGAMTGVLASCVDGIVATADTHTNNHLEGFSCSGISGQCFGWDAGAEPTTGSTNNFADFDASSQFSQAADPGTAACTSGQLLQRSGGATSLYACQSSLMVLK